jgi:hypothetical protein
MDPAVDLAGMEPLGPQARQGGFQLDRIELGKVSRSHKAL